MHERRHLARLSRRLLFRLATSWERMIRSIPGGGAAAFQLASRYVAGTGRQDALDCAWQLAGRDISASIDFFGESVEDPIEADRVSADYVDLAAALTSAPDGTFLSIDLSHLALDRDPAGVRRRLESIAAALPSAARIQIGAEDAYRPGRSSTSSWMPPGPAFRSSRLPRRTSRGLRAMPLSTPTLGSQSGSSRVPTLRHPISRSHGASQPITPSSDSRGACIPRGRS